MSSANWNSPVISDLYTDFLSFLKSRDEDLALMFDGVTPTNIVTGTIRWNSTNSRFEKWSGTVWGALDTDYEINVTSVGGSSAAQLLARANHTGTQPISTITDVTATAAEVNTLDKASALGVSEASKVVTCDASRNVTNLNNVTSTTFTGALTGNVTGNVNGNCSGSSGSCTGNAATATTASACSGNSATATALATARNFSLTGDVTATAVAFNGTGNVALAASIANGAVTSTKLVQFTAGTTYLAGPRSICKQVNPYSWGNAKIYEALVPIGGTVTVRMERWPGTTQYAQIYVNDVARGTLRYFGSTASFDENITLNAGDRLQVWGNFSSDTITNDNIRVSVMASNANVIVSGIRVVYPENYVNDDPLN